MGLLSGRNTSLTVKTGLASLATANHIKERPPQTARVFFRAFFRREINSGVKGRLSYLPEKSEKESRRDPNQSDSSVKTADQDPLGLFSRVRKFSDSQIRKDWRTLESQARMAL